MTDVLTPNGTVVSASQREYFQFSFDKKMPPLVGIILTVHPSDDITNLSALQNADFRGHRLECTVLASSYFGQEPSIRLENVIIPPMRHSGLDNYEEDLPRGCSHIVDTNNVFDSNFSSLDYSKLDGEWCVINFIGGCIESPFIMSWWPHPSNFYELATSAHGNDQKSLLQANPAIHKFRSLRRVNGTTTVVNKYGSVYLDTTESNSLVKINDNKLERSFIDKGGHVQVDVNKHSQFEVNWNEKEHKGPRLGAGSESQFDALGESVFEDKPVHDVDLPHPDQPVMGGPKLRGNERTLVRGKEYELVMKTSKFLVYAEAGGNYDGELKLIADKLFDLHSGETINVLSDKEIIVKANNTYDLDAGDSVNIDGGTSVDIKGGVSASLEGVATLDLKGQTTNLVSTSYNNNTINASTTATNVTVSAASVNVTAANTSIIGLVALGNPVSALPLVMHTPWMFAWNTLSQAFNALKQVAESPAGLTPAKISDFIPVYTAFISLVQSFAATMTIQTRAF